jgi:hypothetical protein
MTVSELIDLLSKENQDALVSVPYIYSGRHDGYTDKIEFDRAVVGGNPTVYIDCGDC